jgi:tetratricopeptide (TPR) repeat protein
MQVEGEVSGQVAAGLYNVQIGSVHGGVVNINPQGQPTLQPKSRPVRALPRRIGWYVNREQELATATRALEEFESVEFRGRAGMGKTVLLRRLTHNASEFQDGIVYSRVNDRPVEDILQELFDRFYESTDANYKPRRGQLLDALQNVEALIVFDDLEETRDAVEELFNALPGCTFLLASTEQRLWGEGREIGLKGLSPADALKLVERELGRELDQEEAETAKELAEALEGHPQSILQAAAKIRDEGIAIADVGRRLIESAEALTGELLDALSESEKEVLAMLTSLEGTPLHEEHIEALIEGDDVKSILEKLLARRLIQAHSPEYSIAPNLVGPLHETLDISSWPEAIAGRLVSWGQQQRDNPNLILRDAAAFLHVLDLSSQADRWQPALDLALVVEGPMAIGKRWQAWGGALESALQAARELALEPAEALVLHQLGTRALLRGEKHEARKLLAAAWRMRKSLGDKMGAAISGHNLGHLPLIAIIPPVLAESVLMTTLLAIPVIVVLVFLSRDGTQSPPIMDDVEHSGVLTVNAGRATRTVTPTGSAQPGLSLTDDGRPSSTGEADEQQPLEVLLTASPSATASATASITSSATPTASPTPTDTATPTPTDTATPTPTDTPTPTPTDTPTPTPTNTATPTPTDTPTPLPPSPPTPCPPYPPYPPYPPPCPPYP